MNFLDRQILKCLLDHQQVRKHKLFAIICHTTQASLALPLVTRLDFANKFDLSRIICKLKNKEENTHPLLFYCVKSKAKATVHTDKI